MTGSEPNHISTRSAVNIQEPFKCWSLHELQFKDDDVKHKCCIFSSYMCHEQSDSRFKFQLCCCAFDTRTESLTQRQLSRIGVIKVFADRAVGCQSCRLGHGDELWLQSLLFFFFFFSETWCSKMQEARRDDSNRTLLQQQPGAARNKRRCLHRAAAFFCLNVSWKKASSRLLTARGLSTDSS